MSAKIDSASIADVSENTPSLHFETYPNKGKDWILFIHGAGGSTRTWKRQIEAFGREYQLLLIDLPGHGENALYPNEIASYSFISIANEIWKVVDNLKIKKLHILGVSLGAIFAYR